MKGISILSPTAILGYGYPSESFSAGLRMLPAANAVDAGSTDPGPYYLGAGKSFTQRRAVKRDLRPILRASAELSIPVLIGSAGGSGAEPHLTWLEAIIGEIYVEEGFSLRTCVIPADVPKPTVMSHWQAGRITPCGTAPPLKSSDIENSTHIVAQMGTEPFLDALDQGYQVIVAGRAYDPAPFAAVPIRSGFDPGLALHMGKILECAAIAAQPGSGADCMMGTIDGDSFTLRTLTSHRSCTKVSVAAHTLYEKSDPWHLPGPGGVLNLEAARFTENSDGSVTVRGTRFERTPYQVKLEGAERIGYRSIAIAGIRDPILINQLDSVLEMVKRQVMDQWEGSADAQLHFHCYGKNGVMGPLEPILTPSHEIGLVLEATAPDQEQAASLCGLIRSTLLHFGYPGRISTAGNLAFPYSPSDLDAGEVYRFSIHHLMPVDDAGRELFQPKGGADFGKNYIDRPS